MIFSKVAACTSQPMVFNEHPNTRGHLTGLRKKPQKKHTINFNLIEAVVLRQLVSLLIELLIGDEKRSLTPIVCVCGGFGQIWSLSLSHTHTHTHTRTHTRAHTHTHIHTHNTHTHNTHTHTYIYVCMYVSMYVFMYTSHKLKLLMLMKH